MPDGEGWGFGQKYDWGLGAACDVRWAGEDKAKVAKEPKVKRVERMCMVEEVWDGWELVIYFALNVSFSSFFLARKGRLFISKRSSCRTLRSSKSHDP